MARPTVMTDETVQKLEEAFSFGCTDDEACCYAGISIRSLYYYCENNEKFLHKKELLKNHPVMKAKRIVNQSLDTGDLNTAQKVIDRKEGSKVNTVLTGADGGAVDMKWTVEVINA